MLEPIHQLMIGRASGNSPSRAREVDNHGSLGGADAGSCPGDLEHRNQGKKRNRFGGEPEEPEILKHGGIVEACFLFERAFRSRIRIRLPQSVDELAILSAEVFFLSCADVIGDSVLVYHSRTSLPALDQS